MKKERRMRRRLYDDDEREREGEGRWLQASQAPPKNGDPTLIRPQSSSLPFPSQYTAEAGSRHCFPHSSLVINRCLIVNFTFVSPSFLHCPPDFRPRTRSLSIKILFISDLMVGFPTENSIWLQKSYLKGTRGKTHLKGGRITWLEVRAGEGVLSASALPYRGWQNAWADSEPIISWLISRSLPAPAFSLTFSPHCHPFLLFQRAGQEEKGHLLPSILTGAGETTAFSLKDFSLSALWFKTWKNCTLTLGRETDIAI